MTPDPTYIALEAFLTWITLMTIFVLILAFVPDTKIEEIPNKGGE